MAPLRDHIVSRRLVLAGGASLCLSKAANGNQRSSARVIRFGLTPVFLISDLELLDRLKSYLEKVTGHPVLLVMRRTYQEITALLLSGQLDAAWICGYPYVAHAQELQLIAVPVWQGRPQYRSYLIVERDRGGEGLANLQGDIHAFSDPDSNSGFLVTRALLAEVGLRPENHFSRSFFTYGHRNVIRAVASGLAKSGSVDGYVYDVVAQLEPSLTASTRVMRASELLGFPPIAAPRNAVDERRLKRLTDALLGMSADDDGRKVLALLQLDGFVSGKPELFAPIAAKAALVSSTGG